MAVGVALENFRVDKRALSLSFCPLSPFRIFPVLIMYHSTHPARIRHVSVRDKIYPRVIIFVRIGSRRTGDLRFRRNRKTNEKFRLPIKN